MKSFKVIFLATSFFAFAVSPLFTQDASTITAAAYSSDNFAFDLYKKLSYEDNFFFSPLGVCAAFSMAYEGSAGATREEFRRIFYFPEDAEANRKYFGRIAAEMNFSGPDGEMAMANSLWAHKDYHFLSSYLEVIRNRYSADAQNLDFVAATEESRKKINEWASGKTRNKIISVLPPRSLNALTRLVLANAAYFKGFWETKFKKENTYRDIFLKSEKEKKPVMMMKSAGEMKAPYTENEYAKILELPYRGSRFSMVIILPPPGGMKKLEEALTAENFRKWEKGLYKRGVKVFLPRFKMDFSLKLHEILPSMGMASAFTDAADFRGMDGTKRLYIQKAFHEALIEVNEEGSEAAAVTAVAVGIKSIEIPPIFKANSPFIFLIKDRKGGSIIFMGKVSDPDSR